MATASRACAIWVTRLIHGKRAPIVGGVSMDALTVDITEIPEAKLWDVTTLMGRDGDEEISVHDIAKLKNSASYDVLCSWRGRLPRIYVNDEPAHETPVLRSEAGLRALHLSLRHLGVSGAGRNSGGPVQRRFSALIAPTGSLLSLPPDPHRARQIHAVIGEPPHPAERRKHHGEADPRSEFEFTPARREFCKRYTDAKFGARRDELRAVGFALQLGGHVTTFCASPKQPPAPRSAWRRSIWRATGWRSTTTPSMTSPTRTAASACS
jgi:hypothetical protein